MIGAVILGLIGAVCIVIGYLLWKKERISLLHDYHYDKVSKEDKRAFCTITGIGVMLIGIGLFITGVVIGITDSTWSFIIFAAFFLAGLVMLVYAGAGIIVNHYAWFSN